MAAPIAVRIHLEVFTEDCIATKRLVFNVKTPRGREIAFTLRLPQREARKIVDSVLILHTGTVKGWGGTRG